jgi:hypothetical protein
MSTQKTSVVWFWLWVALVGIDGLVGCRDKGADWQPWEKILTELKSQGEVVCQVEPEGDCSVEMPIVGHVGEDIAATFGGNDRVGGKEVRCHFTGKAGFYCVIYPVREKDGTFVPVGVYVKAGTPRTL